MRIALIRRMELSAQLPVVPDAAPSDAPTADLPHDPRLAALPEHLTPLRILGQGGSSVVYEALHTRLKVKVALKLLTIDGPYADQARTRMAREAELYALLDDPRIPRVYDVNELPDGTPYVVMEMVPGESLEELLARQGRLSAEHALPIAREVLLALASVHERGVLHRDVKPANVILTLSQEGPAQVRLVDFGIAKMSPRAADGEEREPYEEAAVTQRGTLVGTPHYMAPERLAGHPADASTDVYAVGIMLYEMLAGVVPFTGSSLPLIMAAVMREVPPTLEERGVGVSHALSSLVMKAMAREPSDRFLSARDMLAALDALAAHESERVLSVFDGDSFDDRPRKRTRLWLSAGLAVAAALAAGLMLADEPVEQSAQAQPAVQQPAGVASSVQAGSALVPPLRPALSPLAPPTANAPGEQAAPEFEPTSARTAAELKARQRRLRQERREEEAWREYQQRRESQREDDLRRQQRAADFSSAAQILPENPY